AAATAARLPPARDLPPHRYGRPPPGRGREPEKSCGCLPIAPHRRSAPARWKRRAKARSSGGAWLRHVRGYAGSKPPAVWSSQKSLSCPTACNCTRFERKGRVHYRSAKRNLDDSRLLFRVKGSEYITPRSG